MRWPCLQLGNLGHLDGSKSGCRTVPRADTRSPRSGRSANDFHWGRIPLLAALAAAAVLALVVLAWQAQAEGGDTGAGTVDSDPLSGFGGDGSCLAWAASAHPVTGLTVASSGARQAVATISVGGPGTVYVRFALAGTGNWNWAAHTTAGTGDTSVAVHLNGLAAVARYDVQASADKSFPASAATHTATFTSRPTHLEFFLFDSDEPYNPRDIWGNGETIRAVNDPQQPQQRILAHKRTPATDYLLRGPDVMSREVKELFTNGLPAVTPRVANTTTPKSTRSQALMGEGDSTSGWGRALATGGASAASSTDARTRAVTSQGPIYTWEDGDRTRRVWLQVDLVAQSSAVTRADDIVTRDDGRTSVVQKQSWHAESDTQPVFRSQSGDLLTLPGGVLLFLDPTWDEERVSGFFLENGIDRQSAQRQNYGENAFFLETEPGLPSLVLANELAGQDGVLISSPNWGMEVALN